MKTYIGIDNGTGGIGIINENGWIAEDMPSKEVLSYTAIKQYVTRIDRPKLLDLLSKNVYDNSHCLIERPMVNPMRFKPTMSSIRCYEVVLTVLEELEIPYETIDSKKWQKELLPSGLKKNQTKRASKQIGEQLFPGSCTNGKDCDAILMAEYARRTR